MTEIVIVNQSTALTDAQIQAVIPAWQKWLNTLVAPAYGLDQFALFFSGGKSGGPDFSGMWKVEVLDHADEPDALGYHLDDQGRVSGKLFAADCIADGVSWSVDGTHELGEMAVDPTANILVALPGGVQTIKEIADPVEGDQLGIEIDGVLCSDFVLPSYFSEGPGPWDMRSQMLGIIGFAGPAPTLAPGGYISLMENGQWTQKFAELADGRLSDRAARHVQRLGRHAWRRLVQ